MSTNIDKRRGFVLDFINKNPRATEEEITEYIVKEMKSGSQSTINRDLKALGFKKNADGVFRKTEDKLVGEQRKMLKDAIAYENPKIYPLSKSLYQVIISTSKGMENSISDLICKVYEGEIVGTLAGNGCVVVINYSKKTANSIVSTLKEYREASARVEKKTINAESKEALKETNNQSDKEPDQSAISDS